MKIKGLSSLRRFVIFTIMTMMFAVPVMAQDIRVVCDGQEIEFDQQPINENGRVMVSIRFVAETLEWDVSYGDEGVLELFKTIEDVNTRYDTSIDTARVEIRKLISVDQLVQMSDTKKMNPEPTIVNGRTLVGVRQLAEALYAQVDWDGNTKTIIITSKPLPYSDGQVEQGVTQVENRYQRYAGTDRDVSVYYERIYKTESVDVLSNDSGYIVRGKILPEKQNVLTRFDGYTQTSFIVDKVYKGADLQVGDIIELKEAYYTQFLEDGSPQTIHWDDYWASNEGGEYIFFLNKKETGLYGLSRTTLARYAVNDTTRVEFPNSRTDDYSEENYEKLKAVVLEKYK